MLTGVILVGGRNDFLGSSLKSLLTIRGQSIIEKQIKEMESFCTEIIIVTNQSRSFLPVVPRDVRIITDYYKQKGPLGGIHAALSLAQTTNIWVVSCDMPFISTKVVQSMLTVYTDTRSLALLPVINDDPYFYYSIYRKDLLPYIVEALEANMGHPSCLLERMDWTSLEGDFFIKNNLDPSCFYTIDTDQSIEEAEKWLTTKS